MRSFHLQRERGGALISALIAAMLLGLTASYFASLHRTSLRANKRVETDLERSDVKRYVMQAIDCGATVAAVSTSTCAGPISLQKLNGAELAATTGSRIGRWVVRAECIANEGIRVSVASIKPTAAITTTNADDFNADALNGAQKLNWNHPKANLFGEESPHLCTLHFGGSSSGGGSTSSSGTIGGGCDNYVFDNILGKPRLRSTLTLAQYCNWNRVKDHCRCPAGYYQNGFNVDVCPTMYRSGATPPVPDNFVATTCLCCPLSL